MQRRTVNKTPATTMVIDRRTDSRIRTSLIYSMVDGAFSAAMIGFGETFLVAYGLLLKATTFQIGLLSSLPQALGSLLQVFSNWLIRGFASRKRLVVSAALLQGLMYVPVVLVFFFGQYRIWYLILLVGFYWAFGMIQSRME